VLGLLPEGKRTEEAEKVERVEVELPKMCLDLGKKAVSEVMEANQPPFYQDAWKKKKRCNSASTE